MSVNINVNGKFSRQSILSDTEHCRKQLENERRKLRLQQVRAQSKELARKIRTDVSKEKERQLRNLEAVKAQELDLWRRNVVAHKNVDYQNALNQVGNAHYAARLERQAGREKTTPMRVNRSPQKSRQTSQKAKKAPEVRQQKKQHHEERGVGEPAAIMSGKKRKRLHVCFDEKYETCSCSTLSDSDIELKCCQGEQCELLQDSTASSLSSLDVCCQKNPKSTQTDKSKEPTLQRAPAVLLDCDIETSESAGIVVAPAQVTDKHVETNRQFDSVVSTSPRKNTISTQTTATMASLLLTKDTNEMDASARSKPSAEVGATAPHARYTQISDLIAKQQNAQAASTSLADKPSHVIIPMPSVEDIDAAPSTTNLHYLNKEALGQAPVTKIITSQRRSTAAYPSRFSRTSMTSRATTTSTQDGTDKNEPRSSAVQFYDYNNKYSKEYSQPPNAVAVPQTLELEPNAMEQAALEKKRLKEREKHIEKLRQKSEERGRAALEREQVRRDCADLTEKLDAVMQKRQTMLPTDAHLHGKAYYAELAARKERKMNNAIEELLSRPVIITCPDRRHEMPTTYEVATKSPRQPYTEELNLGSSRLSSGESRNTESSGSILLGYIDDQREQIRDELAPSDKVKNAESRDKLTVLLERIEGLRESLLNELNRSPEEVIGDAAKAQQTFKENDVADKKKCKPKGAVEKVPSPLDARERELKEKEDLLQQKLAEVLQLHKNLKSAQDKSETVKSTAVKITAGNEQVIERTTVDKPLEIVIKLKGDKLKSAKRKQKQTQDAKEEEEEAIKEKPKAPTISAVQPKATAATLPRRGSYDSNSTAYQSMPPALTDATGKFVKRMQQLEDTSKKQSTRSASSASTEAQGVEIRQRPRAHLNPLIAQYIQRLLGMSRESVTALGVSSSDIDTPSSSVVNVTANMGTPSDGPSSMLSEDHVQRVERFINENRSFINELEESIRTHSTASLETSMRQFEEIWKQKFKRSKQPNQGPILKAPKPTASAAKSKSRKETAHETVSRAVQTKSEKPAQKQLQVKEVKVKKTTARLERDDNKESETPYATQTQLQHYAELTQNCSKRISELTALITKVRQEKQRLLEVTLTSISDNGRNSTEYAELPATKSDNSEATLSNTRQKLQELPAAPMEPDAAPLEKHKQTGRSRDSGISMPSRPVTALGHDTDPEPHSFASSTGATNTQTSATQQQQRKQRHPPPTLHRYSPQIPEDDIGHELSTIVEVDTPATSRINTSIQTETQQATTSQATRQPVAFPTFEEYIKELNINLTMLDPEQSLRMEHEYNDLVEALKDGHGDKEYNYEEFPTLTAYLKNMTGSDMVCHSPETIEDLFGCLRLAPLIAKPFPSHREYLDQLPTSTSDAKYLDSASLENLTEAPSANSETESETLDIEEELKRRNILKHSFRSDPLSSSTADKETQEHSKASSTITTTLESGIDKLTTISTSTDSVSERFQSELRALGLKWHTPMRAKEKEAAALCSSSSISDRTPPSNATNLGAKIPVALKKKETDTAADYASGSECSDHPINLREFLTRELLKHVSISSSCESSLSGESLRSQFFMSVLNSMTPSGSAHTNTHTNTASNNALERQKTSTPVKTSTTYSRPVDEHSKSNEAAQSQLFSGESNLSDVHAPAKKRVDAKKKSPSKTKTKPRENKGNKH